MSIYLLESQRDYFSGSGYNKGDNDNGNITHNIIHNWKKPTKCKY